MNGSQYAGLWLAVAVVALGASESRTTEKLCTDYEEAHKIVAFAKRRVRCKFARLRPTLKMKDTKVSLTNLRMWLERDGRLVGDVEVLADGIADFPVIDMKLAAKTKLCASHEVLLDFNVEARPPPTNEVPYRELFVFLDDVNAFTEEMAGIMSWFIRDKGVIAFKFDRPATIEVLSQKRRRKYATAGDLVIKIERHDTSQDENPPLRFSARPVDMKPLD